MLEAWVERSFRRRHRDNVPITSAGRMQLATAAEGRRILAKPRKPPRPLSRPEVRSSQRLHVERTPQWYRIRLLALSLLVRLQAEKMKRPSSVTGICTGRGELLRHRRSVSRERLMWSSRSSMPPSAISGFAGQNNANLLPSGFVPSRTVAAARCHFFMVADGMGGHAVGELASKIAADTVPHTFFKTREPDADCGLREAIEAANATIHDRGSQNHDFQRMGTTCIDPGSMPAGAIIGHVGDSRVYRIRSAGSISSHSTTACVWELIRQRKSTPSNAEQPVPAQRHHPIAGPGPESPGRYRRAVFRSDPATFMSSAPTDSPGMSPTPKLAPSPATAAADACRLLVNLANLRGGPDNITVVVVRVGPSPDGHDETFDDTPPRATARRSDG